MQATDLGTVFPGIYAVLNLDLYCSYTRDIISARAMALGTRFPAIYAVVDSELYCFYACALTSARAGYGFRDTFSTYKIVGCMGCTLLLMLEFSCLRYLCMKMMRVVADQVVFFMGLRLDNISTHEANNIYYIHVVLKRFNTDP